MKSILVTGGAGFIGSNFVLNWLANESTEILNLDALTYAGRQENLAAVNDDSRHRFVVGDVSDTVLLSSLFRDFRPRSVVHFAAETHVDRSIYSPDRFIETNVIGTLRLLNSTLEYWKGLPTDERSGFRFLHISTDEVYGSLGPDDPACTEDSAYRPSSPYAASKAAADHLVRSFHHTYGLPILITNCSNNFGPRQYPEKFIPLVITNALIGNPLPVYGDGMHVRDWLYVHDHCDAIRLVLKAGVPGHTYNISGSTQKTNIEVVHTVLASLQGFVPKPVGYYRSLITFVADRPGHDRRYALDSSKIKNELGWAPKHSFEDGIRSTVKWYIDNEAWLEQVVSGEYKKWVKENYEYRRKHPEAVTGLPKST